MKILIGIPHYYNQDNVEKKHGSSSNTLRNRIFKLKQTICKLYQCFSTNHKVLNIEKRMAESAETQHDVDIVIHTLNDHHLLNLMPELSEMVEHKIVDADPKMLGFECHKTLVSMSNEYDFYGYLEDDLWIHDPLFFEKLKWFSQSTSDNCLLLPNRFEVQEIPSYYKLYIDGNIRIGATANYRVNTAETEILLKGLGEDFKFMQTANPHSGCFFLNRVQVNLWKEHKSFADHDVSFISPLESAATLSVLKVFNIFKPMKPNLNFFEIEHAGNAFFSLLGNKVQVD